MVSGHTSVDAELLCKYTGRNGSNRNLIGDRGIVACRLR